MHNSQPRIDQRICLVLLIVITVWSVLPGSAPVAAQPAPGPIILNIDGDLWAWDGPDQPLEQLTFWGANYRPILSPDGTRVAYTSMPQVARDWLRAAAGAGGFDIPLNIWMLDIPSGHTYRIADQPADAAYAGPNQPGRYTLRTEPAWSPDGTQLVWGALPIDGLAPTYSAQLCRQDIDGPSFGEAAARRASALKIQHGFSFLRARLRCI